VPPTVDFLAKEVSVNLGMIAKTTNAPRAIGINLYVILISYQVIKLKEKHN
jgi:hypothetical protein